MSLDLPDWESQRAFLAVLREGSLSGAARVLNVAQPTVRRRLEVLERSVGAALFTRSPTGLMPTEAARMLGQYAETMASAAAAFTRAASADAGAASGTVRITASDVIGAEVLPGLLVGLRRAHPGLALEIHLSNRAEDLLSQQADIAIRMVRPLQAAVVAKSVGAVKLGFFAADAYVRDHGLPQNIADLRHHALIGPDRAAEDLQVLQGCVPDIGLPMFAIRTDSHLAQLAAIRAGLGIGVCQAALARRGVALIAVLPDIFAPQLQTWIAMHEDLRRVERVRLTFDHLARAMSDYIAGH